MRVKKGFVEKRQKGDLDRMTHCWFKVTDYCLDKVVQTKAKYRAKRKIRMWKLICLEKHIMMT